MLSDVPLRTRRVLMLSDVPLRTCRKVINNAVK